MTGVAFAIVQIVVVNVFGNTCTCIIGQHNIHLCNKKITQLFLSLFALLYHASHQTSQQLEMLGIYLPCRDNHKLIIVVEKLVNCHFNYIKAVTDSDGVNV